MCTKGPPAKNVALDLKPLHETGRLDAVVCQDGQRVALRQGVKVECVKLKAVRRRQNEFQWGHL